jgi:hypothetical protein
MLRGSQAKDNRKDKAKTEDSVPMDLDPRENL